MAEAYAKPTLDTFAVELKGKVESLPYAITDNIKHVFLTKHSKEENINHNEMVFTVLRQWISANRTAKKKFKLRAALQDSMTFNGKHYISNLESVSIAEDKVSVTIKEKKSAILNDVSIDYITGKLLTAKSFRIGIYDHPEKLIVAVEAASAKVSAKIVKYTLSLRIDKQYAEEEAKYKYKKDLSSSFNFPRRFFTSAPEVIDIDLIQVTDYSNSMYDMTNLTTRSIQGVCYIILKKIPMVEPAVEPDQVVFEDL